MNELVLLFDDITLLETALGEGALTVSSVNANCDCVSYTAIDDDQDFNPPARPSTSIAAS